MGDPGGKDGNHQIMYTRLSLCCIFLERCACTRSLTVCVHKHVHKRVHKHVPSTVSLLVSFSMSSHQRCKRWQFRFKQFWRISFFLCVSDKDRGPAMCRSCDMEQWRTYSLVIGVLRLPAVMMRCRGLETLVQK